MHHILSGSMGQPCPSGDRASLILLVYYDYPVLKMGKAFINQGPQHVHRPVLRPVIHKDELDVAVGLSQKGFSKLADIGLDAIYRNDH